MHHSNLGVTLKSKIRIPISTRSTSLPRGYNKFSRDVFWQRDARIRFCVKPNLRLIHARRDTTVSLVPEEKKQYSKLQCPILYILIDANAVREKASCEFKNREKVRKRRKHCGAENEKRWMVRCCFSSLSLAP